MAKYDIKEFNYITAGKKQNTFNIGYCYTDDMSISEKTERPSYLGDLVTQTVFGNIAESESFHDAYGENMGNLYEIDNNIALHNLYPLARTKVKTDIMRSTGEYYEAYTPVISADYLDMCQYKNHAFAITYPTTDSYIMLSTEKNSNYSFDYFYHNKLSAEKIKTYLYPTPEDLMEGATTYTEIIDNNPEVSDDIIYKIFQAKRNLAGIEYNYFIDFPIETTYNDYEDGCVLAGVNYTKNHLDYMYCMSVDGDYNLNQAREYCGIGACGQRMYMKYRNNVYYNSDRSYTITYRYPDQSYQNELISTITDYKMTKHRRDYSYQFVEVVNSINKYDNSSQGRHKSSMFSITINDYGFNDFQLDDGVKSKLKQSIKNNLKVILDTIIPANTQLFEIYYTGK